jgi:hypothetical protein
MSGLKVLGDFVQRVDDSEPVSSPWPIRGRGDVILQQFSNFFLRPRFNAQALRQWKLHWAWPMDGRRQELARAQEKPQREAGAKGYPEGVMCP